MRTPLTPQAERVTCKERTKKLEALSKLKQEEDKLRASLQKMHDHDPTVLRGLKRAAESSFADCNRRPRPPYAVTPPHTSFLCE
jgi:hypothetical protein